MKIISLSLSLISCSLAERDIYTKYYLDMHPAYLNTINEQKIFRFQISKKELENLETYFEVHYKNKTLQKAFLHRKLRIQYEHYTKTIDLSAQYEFDLKGRVIFLENRDMKCHMIFEKQKKVENCLNKKTSVTNKYLYEYKNDKLYKKSTYNKQHYLIQYSIFNYESLQEQIYNADNKLLKYRNIHIKNK